MKLSLFTDEVSQDLATAVRMAVRYGLDGVELRTVWNTPVQHLSEAEVNRVRGLLSDHGLAAAAIASPVFKCELGDEAAHREHLDFLRNCVRIANCLGTAVVRVFTFWKRGPSAPVWGQAIQAFRPAVAIAADAGVTLAIENEHTTYCATADETARFIAEVNSPSVRATWDPCNEIHADEGITPYPDAYRLIADHAVHVHVKDGERDPRTGKPRVTAVGDGAVDWKGQLAALVRRGYQGYASLETHWRPQALPEGALDQPGGQGFSEMGEYASDQCLGNLLAILADARREAR